MSRGYRGLSVFERKEDKERVRHNYITQPMISPPKSVVGTSTGGNSGLSDSRSMLSPRIIGNLCITSLNGHHELFGEPI